MVSYEDVGAAIDWLGDAFGFRESGQRFADAEGRVTHAELELDGATVMLGWPGPDYRSPAHHAQECYTTPWTQGPREYVDVAPSFTHRVVDVELFVERHDFIGGATVPPRQAHQP